MIFSFYDHEILLFSLLTTEAYIIMSHVISLVGVSVFLLFFNMSRKVFIKNSIMQISVDKQHLVDGALMSKIPISPINHK